MQMSFLTSQDGKAVWFQATPSIPPAVLPGRRGSAFPGLGVGNPNKCVGPCRVYGGHPHTWGFLGALEASECDIPGW